MGRWKMVLAQNPTLLQIRMMDDSPRTFASVYRPAENTVILTAGEKGVFTYSRPDAEHVTMTGTLDSDSAGGPDLRRKRSLRVLARKPRISLDQRAAVQPVAISCADRGMS